MTLPVHVARQLWIQLRLLGLLVLPSAAAIVAVIIEGQAGSEAARLALGVGFAVAAVLSAALVGTGFAEEIGSGAAAWLIVRAVPRNAVIGAWLGLPMAAILFAYVLAGILAGLAIPPSLARTPDPLAIAVAVVASAAPAFALSAASLAIAVHATGRITAVATVGGAAILAVPLVLIGASAVHPASGFWLAAGIAPGNQPITVGLEAIGLCLLLTAVIWVIAARRFGGRDL